MCVVTWPRSQCSGTSAAKQCTCTLPSVLAPPHVPCFQFVVLNILIAIISDAYAEQQEKLERSRVRAPQRKSYTAGLTFTHTLVMRMNTQDVEVGREITKYLRSKLMKIKCLKPVIQRVFPAAPSKKSKSKSKPARRNAPFRTKTAPVGVLTRSTSGSRRGLPLRGRGTRKSTTSVDMATPLPGQTPSLGVDDMEGVTRVRSPTQDYKAVESRQGSSGLPPVLTGEMPPKGRGVVQAPLPTAASAVSVHPGLQTPSSGTTGSAGSDSVNMLISRAKLRQSQKQLLSSRQL